MFARLAFLLIVFLSIPAHALTVSQVVEASDLIAKVKSLKASIDTLDAMKDDDVHGTLYTGSHDTVTSATMSLSTRSTCGCCVCYKEEPRDNTPKYVSVVLSKEAIRKALQKEIDSYMDRLNDLGVKP